MNLKSILKALKLNESTISMILGALVIVVVGVLVINYFKGKESGTTLPSGVTTQQETTKVGGIHTVAAGETLWSIAEKYYSSGYNWVDIAKENKLANAGFIEEGQKLTIPDVPAKTLTVVAAKSAGSTEGAISGTTYEVVKGDNLWNIAVRAYGDGYRWVDISKENKLLNPNIIHSGNILILPR